jgi:hypothetical protein
MSKKPWHRGAVEKSRVCVYKPKTIIKTPCREKFFKNVHPFGNQRLQTSRYGSYIIPSGSHRARPNKDNPPDGSHICQHKTGEDGTKLGRNI